MSNIEFSPKQREVIDTRNRNILVSAAAGSGKTAVLVQRIIERVLGSESDKVDEEELIDIDQILVLTYTEAAAGEMRERIEDAINKRVMEEPENKRIARQAVLVHNAQISTIHGFCLSLIRNNFAEIELDPSFRVAESGEIKMVEDEIAEELIEELFEGEIFEEFGLLADRFVRKNNLNRLKDIILEAYSVSRNNPFVHDYLIGLRENYRCDETVDILSTEWGKHLYQYSIEQIEQAIELTRFNMEYASSGPYMYMEALESDMELLEELLKCRTYDDFYAHLGNMSFAALSKKKDENVSEESRKESQNIRKEAKGIITKLSEDFYAANESAIRYEMTQNSKVINVLTKVLLMFDGRLEEEKKRRKIIDFSDMEHYALRILLKKSEGEYIATQVARDCRAAYKEIMVDEYQDSNHVQEYILKAISGEEDANYNRFMVGDVKQSIYSFRNACPELFMGKYAQYALDGEDNVRIDLSTNYRSRKEVLNSVNHIFERIMGEDLGGVGYSEDVRLNLGAKYDETKENYKTELLLLNYDTEAEQKKQEQEACMVAQKINELVNGKKPFVLNDNRKCQYKDIVILLRSNKGWDDIFKKTLEQNGIPAYIASKTGYFSTTEIKRMLNLLQVLDNPREDIALYGVLSTFGGLREEEVATIRAYKKESLYESISAVYEGTFEYIDKLSDETCNKIRLFFEFLNKYRAKTVYTPINELLEEIIEETGYMYEISSLPFGEQRKANVFMLVEKAKQYEAGSFKGLYHFIRYINEIQSFEIDYGEASVLDEQSDVVRIMSIHKSKGLEFPVCFVCGMGKNFNTTDSKSEVVYDRNLGIALDYVDTSTNVKYSDIRRRFLSKKSNIDNVSEEIRVLYVALTRAKEKLYMTACQNKLEDLVARCCRNRMMSHGKVLLSKYARSKASSLLELVLDVVDIDNDPEVKTTIFDLEQLDGAAVLEGVNKEIKKQELLKNVEGNQTIEETDTANNIKNKITFKYLHKELENVYTKTSVSELKMAAIEEAFLNNELEETAVEFFETHDPGCYVPAFVKQEEKVSGTTRGTAYHRVMELFMLADTEKFASTDQDSQEKNRENVADVISQMTRDGWINKEEVELVDINKVVSFLNSDLGGRMLQAKARKQLYLEEPFVLGIGADRINNTCPSNETVLIQGIIDAFFIEDGKAILMDYKTDRVSDEDELIKKYQLQLDYYKEAIERITGMEVAEKLIYSFALEKTIRA